MKQNLFIILLSAALCSIVFSHGVDIVTITGGAGIEARYDSGEPISHAEVTVYSPNEQKEPFQSGTTDSNGRFIFYPDHSGEWKAVVNDWTGHGGTVIVKINEEMKPVPETGGRPPGRGLKVVAGVAVIFGLTGILSFLLARRERRRIEDAHS